MSNLIILFGALTLLAGLAILASPDIVFGPLRRYADRVSIQVTAVAVRLVLGVLLIDQANLSRFPAVIAILGWLSLAAALAIAVMGRSNFKRLMAWAFRLSRKFGRAAGIFAVSFGAFLVYAFAG
jgi:hypothetical protein